MHEARISFGAVPRWADGSTRGLGCSLAEGLPLRPLLKSSAGSAGEHPVTEWPTGDGNLLFKEIAYMIKKKKRVWFCTLCWRSGDAASLDVAIEQHRKQVSDDIEVASEVRSWAIATSGP